MKRRVLLAMSGALPALSSVSAVSTALGVAGPAFAAPASAGGWQPVEGQHYEKLATPLPSTGDGRIELVEFFWLGCGHCQAFDPVLEAWHAQRRDVVSLRRVHIAGRAQVVAHQRLFFALQSLGVQDQLRPVVFDLLLGQGKSLNTPQEQATALAAAGIDPKRLMEACQSFSVAAKCQQANQLQERADVNTVPTLMVGGRFKTSPSMAARGARLSEQESGRRALQVVDALLAGPLRA